MLLNIKEIIEKVENIIKESKQCLMNLLLKQSRAIFLLHNFNKYYIKNYNRTRVNDKVFEQIRRVSGDGSPQTASSTPFGDSSATEDGITIVLRGTDSTNTITIENNDAQYGAILNGDATLQNYFEIELMYDAIAERWIEQRRNF